MDVHILPQQRLVSGKFHRQVVVQPAREGALRPAEALVNYIDAIINAAMNGGDPMAVQEPSASCTGSCSTCGGCG